MNPADPAAILAANINFHSALAAGYDNHQPHFRPENVARVESILMRLAEETGGGSLIDFGCGTGFVINIARRYFRRVVGVDITPAMLDRVDKSSGNVETVLTTTDDTPFDDGEFDVCTAYSYLHHLHDLAPTLTEAVRVLRPGGRFFSDQDPNGAFWRHVATFRGRPGLSGFVAREVMAVLETDALAAEETSLTPEEVRLAEYQKMSLGGFDADQVTEQLLDAGFTTAEHRFEWFLGQGPMLHEHGSEVAQTIESYLRAALPASAPFFKYVAFYATR